MEEVKRIYNLLSHSNGLKIKDIAQELDLDKYYVADLLFSTDNIPFWYQDSSSLWFAKEGAIEIEESKETKESLITSIEIPQRFNISRFFEEDLSGSLHSYLYKISKYRAYSNNEMIELFKQYRNGDKKAFDLIIMSQQRLVANIALLYCRKGAPLEDIIQEGNVGLIKAAERFDFTQYRSFSNYAKSWILQSISLAMVSMPYMIRLPLNQFSLYRKVRDFKDHYEQENGYSPSINDIDINECHDLERIKYLDGLPFDLKSLIHLSDNMDAFESRTNAIEDYINKNEAHFSVMNLLCRLRKRERLILQMFYGINRKEESLAFIGDCFGLTRERARQIKEKTIRNLRDIILNGQVKDNKRFLAQDESEEDIADNPGKLPKLLIESGKHIEIYADSERNLSYQNEQKHQTDRKESEIIPQDVNKTDNLKVGDEIYYNKKYCVVRKIIQNGRFSKLFIEYANGVIDVVSYNNSKYEQISHVQKSEQHNLYGIEHSSNIEIKEAMLGDIIKYDSKLCIVLAKKTIKNSLRIIVKYEDGTIDNLHNDWNRYIIINHRDEANNTKNYHSKIEQHEPSKYHLSTPLSELADFNIITEKQLRQCFKRGLMNIGDIKNIIEKYKLTPDSTRFTKYTLDMWFGIIRLLDMDSTGTMSGVENVDEKSNL